MSQKIKSVHFTKDATFIGFVESYQLRDANQVSNEKTPGKQMDLPRHADFELAMDKMKPHLLIACELQKPCDYNGNFLQTLHFNDYFSDMDEEQDRFGGLELTGIIIQGKNTNDGVQLVGTKTTTFGEVIKLKTPSIALVKSIEGYNYPLLSILDVQVDTLLHEAEQYHLRKKHGAGVQTTMAIPEKANPKDELDDELAGDPLDKVISDKKKGSKKQMALVDQE